MSAVVRIAASEVDFECKNSTKKINYKMVICVKEENITELDNESMEFDEKLKCAYASDIADELEIQKK